jgi:hypothetical protein
MKVLVAAVRPPVLVLPEVDWVPDQSPEAVQEVALVDDHVSMDALPLVTDVGLALMDTVGADVDVGGATVTIIDLLALPPAPLQLRLKVLVAVSVPLDWLPEVGLVPDQAPDAVQEVALVDDHVSMDALPLVTDVGLALRDTVGAGGGGGGGGGSGSSSGALTVTVIDWLALPPAPLQLRLKVLVAVSIPLDWLPEVDLVPDQAPEAVQEVALVDDHDRVLEAPLATDVGFVLSDTVGAGVSNAL